MVYNEQLKKDLREIWANLRPSPLENVEEEPEEENE
jgi:hypothetical protein